ncbi:uroporphyrinogen-III synthase [Falsirhodobacter algicola]|uniref:Uroporphyrinogen-III synthase n=1 Tax=Falsirhodobacter algicola TaxID=2692330 RepID=A0A8J8MTI2_9RHOB|nr:uroporphyrinogen-III synthase [Falsirhodobacter algicola]QUS36451.1 uroporphyrinogen-III synthase [Falsirhodobacter algicola]
MSRQSRPPVLLTRPAAAAARDAQGLDGPVVLSPLAEPEVLCPELPPADGLIFTSARAASALGGRCPALRAWCVGARTAEAARAAGFDAVSADGDAEALIALLLKARPDGVLLHARGEETRGDVAARLTAAGLRVAEAVVYRMAPKPLSEEAKALLFNAAEVIVPLHSPASARRFAMAAAGARARLRLACLSPAVAAAAPPAAETRIAARPDAPSMHALVTAMQRLETSTPQG